MRYVIFGGLHTVVSKHLHTVMLADGHGKGCVILPEVVEAIDGEMIPAAHAFLQWTVLVMTSGPYDYEYFN